MTCMLHQENLIVCVVVINNNKLWKYDGNTGDELGCYEGSIRGITSGEELSLHISYSSSKDIYAFTPNMDKKKLVLSGDFFAY